MSGAEPVEKRLPRPSKAIVVALILGIILAAACIPRTANHLTAITPVSIIHTSSEQLSLNGRVESDEIKLAMMLPGTVSEVTVNEGDHVTKGQVLVRLNSSDAELESKLKSIDQVISATEKMKAKAELWLAELRKHSIKTKKSQLLLAKQPTQKSSSLKAKIQTDHKLNALSGATVNDVAGARKEISPSSANTQLGVPDKENVKTVNGTVAETTGVNKDADLKALFSSMQANATPSLMADSPGYTALSKKELNAKYKEQLAKIDSNHKERKKALKMGHLLVQALADSQNKGKKSILASEDLKAAGFTDILKSEILRSGMVDSSLASVQDLSKLLKSTGEKSSSSQNAVVSEDKEASAHVPGVAELPNLDPNILGRNLSKEKAEALTQLLKSNPVTIVRSSNGPVTGSAETRSPLDTAKLQRILKDEGLLSSASGAAPSTSEQQLRDLLRANKNSKQINGYDFAAILAKSNSSTRTDKFSTLEIETRIAEAEAEIAKAKALRQELLSKRNAGVLTSPVDGIISARNINPGEIALPGRIIIRISSPDRFYVRAFIPEGQLSKIRLGQKATVYLDGEKQHPLTAIVSSIDGEASFTPENVYFKEDRVRQVFGIKLRIDNSNGAAKNGMPADAIVFLFEPKA
ncbi:MAG: HlyD family efflux transporter periplasmic adaptor subunit [Candidatus Obscuribacterales bacterium]|nr:HlyD family efflux transporter periplasmic adaptor subunit [Candidatus Obscuribacterales bacterium]